MKITALLFASVALAHTSLAGDCKPIAPSATLSHDDAIHIAEDSLKKDGHDLKAYEWVGMAYGYEADAKAPWTPSWILLYKSKAIAGLNVPAIVITVADVSHAVRIEPTLFNTGKSRPLTERERLFPK